MGATSVLSAYTYSPASTITYIQELPEPELPTPILTTEVMGPTVLPIETKERTIESSPKIESPNLPTSSLSTLGTDSGLETTTANEDILVTPPVSVSKEALATRTETAVPFFSQFADISSPSWKKIGCGIASLAMLIEYNKPGSVTVDTLLAEGIASDAYIDGVGWSHGGLADLASEYGLIGKAYDLAQQNMHSAIAQLESALEQGPVIASVYYTFDPQSPIPHLVVINGIEDDTVSYNDPAEPRGGGTISKEEFVRAWKKRFIEVRA